MLRGLQSRQCFKGASPAEGMAARSSRLHAMPAGNSTIKLIASDVDGTLLDSQQRLDDRVRKAIVQAADIGVPLIVATGKARGPWIHDVLPYLGSSMPGVFMQGLIVYDADGNKLYSRTLEEDVVHDCISIATKLGVTLAVYTDERIVCKETNEHTDRLIWYKEPTPEPVGPLDKAVHQLSVQKLIFMATQARIDEMRPGIEQHLSGRASLTTALSGMLEVLPLGASKGAGVAWLLEHLGMSYSNVLAVGDGENDLEMLSMAGIGVAMGNAGPSVRAVADAVVATNNEAGVAEAIQRFVLEPQREGLVQEVAVTSA